MRLKNLFKLTALPVVFILLATGCTEKDSKKVLLGQTFYYVEPCKDEVYCSNTFNEDSIIEMEYENGTRTSTHRIMMKYHEEGLIIQDGEKLFPCIVSEKERYLSMHCDYEEQRGIQILWRTLEDAKANKPECQKIEKECKESKADSAPEKQALK